MDIKTEELQQEVYFAKHKETGMYFKAVNGKMGFKSSRSAMISMASKYGEGNYKDKFEVYKIDANMNVVKVK